MGCGSEKRTCRAEWRCKEICGDVLLNLGTRSDHTVIIVSFTAADFARLSKIFNFLLHQ